jgi:hypothetical protein
MYGALEGHSKPGLANLYGEEQVSGSGSGSGGSGSGMQME